VHQVGQLPRICFGELLIYHTGQFTHEREFLPITNLKWNSALWEIDTPSSNLEITNLYGNF